MRKITRFRLLAFLALVMAVAFAGWSVRSDRRIVEYGWDGWGHNALLHIDDGIIAITVANDGPLLDDQGNPWTSPHWYSWENFYGPDIDAASRLSIRTAEFNRFGAGIRTEKSVGLPKGNWRFGGRTIVSVFFPLYLLASICGLIFLYFSGQVLKIRRRMRSSRCLTCGYDLRFSSKRCPECGTEMPSASSVVSHDAAVVEPLRV